MYYENETTNTKAGSMNNSKLGGVCPDRDATVTEELRDYATALKQRLVMLNQMVVQKFAQFYYEEPTPEKVSGSTAVRKMPPALSSIREELDGIDYAIDQVGKNIDRVIL